LLTAQRASLRQLWWILAAAVAVPAILFGYAAWSGYRTANQIAEQQIQRTRDVVSEHALKVFETIDRTISLMDEVARNAPQDELKQREIQLHERLKQIVAGAAQIKSVWIFAADGHSIANSLAFPSPAINFSDRDYFRSHIDRDTGLFVGEVLTPRPPYGGEDFFSISRRRSSPDGRFNGIIQVSLLPDYFAQFYDRIARDDGSYLALHRQDGALLVRHPRGANANDRTASGRLAEAIAQGSPSGVLTDASIDGQERRLSYGKLANYPIYVVAGLETSTIRAAWLKWLSGYLVFGLPATVGLVGLILLAQRRTRRFYTEARKREAAEAALRQARRLEALGQLTGGVAHDFNNLLMVIGGSAQQLKKSPDGPKAIRSLDMIETAVQRATSLTQKLLAFARRRTLEPRVIALPAYLRDFNEVLGRTLRPDIIIRFAGLERELHAELDPDELEVALLNLAVNARDAMPEGGQLTVSLANDAFEREPGPDDLRGEFVTISVADTGSGINADVRGRIFEPFFTTKSPDRGTGLGLSQVYGFAKQSGGAVTVISELGKGSTFTLYLPRSRKVVEAASPGPAQANLRTASGQMALLVEDNADVAEVAGDYLAQLGFSHRHARNADEALRLLRDQTFGFVLSDIVMPGGLSGLDLARVIREHHPELPVILATGYSDRADAALREHFVLLKKPYSLANLKRVIEDALGGQVRLIA
jgi:two-component system NtrC family sensor kinase